MEEGKGDIRTVVMDIKEDRTDRIWLAARKSGLLRFTPRSDGTGQRIHHKTT